MRSACRHGGRRVGHGSVELEGSQQVATGFPGPAHGRECPGEVAVGLRIVWRDVEREGERKSGIPVAFLTEKGNAEIVIGLGVAGTGLDRGCEVRNGLVEAILR